MREFIEQESERLGVTTSEFVRRLFEVYRESRAGNARCDYCEEPVNIELTYT
jgi:aspartate carbamoyltransferase regulatory subunit